MARCDPEQLAVFREFAVEPYYASIVGYGNPDKVIVVARKGNEAMYWEEVEEGFNVSRLGLDGAILEHWCNQDELRWALNYWIEGRTVPYKFLPHD